MEMPEFNWLTVTWASNWLIQYESGLATAEEIRESMSSDPEEIIKLPEAWQLIYSDQSSDLLKGLHMISNHILDWPNMAPLLGRLLEGMFTGELTVQQVVRTLKIIGQKIDSGEFEFSPSVIRDFERDPVKMESFPARLQAIEAGTSSETLEDLQASVDEWLMGYGTP